MIGPDEAWCGWCEDPFYPNQDDSGESVFCSWECSDKHQAQLDRELEVKAQGPGVVYQGKFEV